MKYLYKKQASVDLWARMLQSAVLKASRLCMHATGCGRAFHCIIARGRKSIGDLPEGHGMTVLRDFRDYVSVLYMVREWYGNHGLHVLCKTDEDRPLPFFVPMYAILGLENLSCTCMPIIIADCPASSSSLDLFSLGSPHFSVQIPHSPSIFELWPNQGVSCFTYLWHLCFNISTYEPSVWFAWPVIRSTCEFQGREPEISTRARAHGSEIQDRHL